MARPVRWSDLDLDLVRSTRTRAQRRGTWLDSIRRKEANFQWQPPPIDQDQDDERWQIRTVLQLHSNSQYAFQYCARVLWASFFVKKNISYLILLRCQTKTISKFRLPPHPPIHPLILCDTALIIAEPKQWKTEQTESTIAKQRQFLQNDNHYCCSSHHTSWSQEGPQRLGSPVENATSKTRQQSHQDKHQQPVLFLGQKTGSQARKTGSSRFAEAIARRKTSRGFGQEGTATGKWKATCWKRIQGFATVGANTESQQSGGNTESPEQETAQTNQEDAHESEDGCGRVRADIFQVVASYE